MTRQVDDFHKLERRICLSGILTTRTALRIGSGGSGELDAVDLPVIRDGQGYPLIPGSSMKGVLRSTIESLVRGADVSKETGLWACDPLAGDSGPQNRACGFHKPGMRNQVKPAEHCAVCRLFGSHVVASHVRFSDALIPREDRQRRPPVDIRDGVAIDRDLRTAAGAQKYNFEVVSPGIRFGLEVFIENPQDWLMGLLNRVHPETRISRLTVEFAVGGGLGGKIGHTPAVGLHAGSWFVPICRSGSCRCPCSPSSASAPSIPALASV